MIWECNLNQGQLGDRMRRVAMSTYRFQLETEPAHADGRLLLDGLYHYNVEQTAATSGIIIRATLAAYQSCSRPSAASRYFASWPGPSLESVSILHPLAWVGIANCAAAQ